MRERLEKNRLKAEQKQLRFQQEQKFLEEQQGGEAKELDASRESRKEQEKLEQKQHLDAVIQESIRTEKERQQNVNRQFREFMANMPPGPEGESFAQRLERFNEYVLEQALSKEESP